MASVNIECNRSYIEKKTLSMFNIHITDLHYLVVVSKTVGSQTVYQVIENEPTSHEAYLCSLWIDSAYDTVLGSFKWSFLTEPISFEEIDKSELVADYGYKFAYNIITAYDDITEAYNKKTLFNIASIYSGFDRRKLVNFRKVGNTIYTNDRDLKGSATFKIDLSAYDQKPILSKYINGATPPYITLKENGCPSEFIDLIAYRLAILIAPSIAPKDMQIQQLIAQQYQLANESLLRRECNQIKRKSNEEVE
jgi:hypothetical protein